MPCAGDPQRFEAEIDSLEHSLAVAPFRLSASPKEIFVHPAWRAAEQACLASLSEGGSLLLCGVPGTGKTMLLQSLRATLRTRQQGAVLVQPFAPALEAGETDVLLIDEADRLSARELRLLCTLPNQLVLAGLPCLREAVANVVGVIGSVTLQPLSVGDVASWVSHQLAGSGRADTFFSAEAVLTLAQRSGGLFRVVVLLAGAALFFAELRRAEVVMAHDIEEAAAMREAIGDRGLVTS